MMYHSFAGSLFENFIISEFIKRSTNQGKDRSFYFWRDNTGHEVDIIIEEAGELLPVEIKSGKTITPEYFKGLNYWQKITGTNKGEIIYAGDTEQKRSDGINISGWKSVINL